MPRQTNPDNADSPQEIGDRITAAVKRDANAPRKQRKPGPVKASEAKKKPSRAVAE
jgi:hypothetical protein